jgi:predicted nucleic acid-binding protein
MIIKDSMVVIHLAKITLLETSCERFKPVVVPEEVHREILQGKKKGYEDVKIIEELITAGKLGVKRVREKKLLKRAAEFNVQGGEGEALALYWQEKADYLASDDDNLRKKSTLLNLRLIGTPAIILKLYQEKRIDRAKLQESLQALRKIGWFSNAVIDKILMEAT